MRKYVLKNPEETEAFKSFVAEIGSKEAAQVLWNRGITSKAGVIALSNADEHAIAGDLFDVATAASVIVAAVKSSKKIAVYGDYDADGALAASILWRFLSIELHADATIYIPDRHEEGYGLNRQALDILTQRGIGLIITVDCGVRDKVLIEEFVKETGVEIIVTDHHQPGESFPSCPTVHPLYPGHESRNRYTSGGMVAWKLVRYLEQVLQKDHSYSESVIDLAGISLVTDMMPLQGENRVFVKKALKKIKTKPTLGIRVLLETAQVDVEKITPYHLGFVIGPRLNASGRIADPYLSSRLLSTQQESAAREFARVISDINKQRQDVTQQMLLEAEQIKQIILDKVMVIAKVGWDDGIIGLVAGKVMNKYDVPTIAISIDEQKGIAKGSARSFGSLNITELFERMKDSFARYGGHHSAAGFTLVDIDIPRFIQTLTETLNQSYRDFIPVSERIIDAELSAQSLTDTFFDVINQLEPFGQENPAPLFLIRGKITQFSYIGQQQNHLRIQVQTDSGILKVLFFDGVAKYPNIEQGQQMIAVGKPQREEYNGVISSSFIIESVISPSELF